MLKKPLSAEIHLTAEQEGDIRSRATGNMVDTGKKYADMGTPLDDQLHRAAGSYLAAYVDYRLGMAEEDRKEMQNKRTGAVNRLSKAFNGDQRAKLYLSDMEGAVDAAFDTVLDKGVA